MKNLLCKLLRTAGLLTVGSTLAHAQVVVAFNDSDLGLFTNTAPANWSIGTGNGFLTAASDGSITSINGSYLDQSFSLPGNGHSLTLEVTYLWRGVNIQANGVDVLRMGISSTTALDALPEYSGVLRGTASGNRNHRVGNYSGTNLVQSGANTNIINSNVPLILETVFTRIDSTTLQMSTTFWNATKTVAQIATLDRTITVPAGYFDNLLYAGLFINGDAARTVTTDWTSKIDVDNFTVTAIPEPSTYVALIGLLALAFIVRRRLRK